ncbi:hypothetical protein HGM15179_002667 [Zosterops borbonicus]|uniref:Uncharacterized protein n=1 Tax=Zosterops borbonicus TaxID=364589 RepID=A0A8K1GW56_9PASS|nr:hypothetical protein HGM15179_002667 [Zosterops borbonicus]
MDRSLVSSSEVQEVSRWLSGQGTDLEPGIGLSVGSHRDLVLRPRKVVSIYNHKCAQIPDFHLRKEIEELKGKVTGLMSQNTKTDPKDLLISSSSENDHVEFRKVVAQKATLGSLCGTSQRATPEHLRLTLEAPKVLQDTDGCEGKK